MQQTTRVPDPDPSAPRAGQSMVPYFLRLLGWIMLVAGAVAAVIWWVLFARAPLFPEFSGAAYGAWEEQTQWNAPGIALGFFSLFQGAIAAAVLHALASVVEDLTALRITLKKQALHLLAQQTSEL
jgi:hypothetical protein